MSCRRRSLFLLITLVNGMGCMAPAKSTQSLDSFLPLSTKSSLRRGSSTLDQMAEEFAALKQSANWKSRGYFTSTEHDNCEQLFANYLRRRRWLIKMGASHALPRDYHVDAFAGQCRSEQLDGDSLLVAIFRDDPIAQGKLNEAFHRSGIPREMLDELTSELTHPRTIRFLKNMTQETTPQTKLVSSNTLNLIRSITVERCSRSYERIQSLLEHQFPVMPSISNKLYHLSANQQLIQSGRELHGLWLSARSWLVAGIGRIKNPTSRQLEFTTAQKVKVRRALQPGDVLLSYTAGYASSFFIEGRFKHAIIYIGTVQERRRAGLQPESLDRSPDAVRSRLRDRVDYAVLPTGRETDVVESLSEGVIFNNLNEILDERINRMVVLRPTLTSAERLDALTSVLLFVGDQYDFHFDFADASDQVCTELFYRSFNGKGSIQLLLTRRFGRETLNADDIIRHHLSSNAFELILLVEPSNSRTRSASILFGSEAETRLISLMSAP